MQLPFSRLVCLPFEPEPEVCDVCLFTRGSFANWIIAFTVWRVTPCLSMLGLGRPVVIRLNAPTSQYHSGSSLKVQITCNVPDCLSSGNAEYRYALRGIQLRHGPGSFCRWIGRTSTSFLLRARDYTGKTSLSHGGQSLCRTDTLYNS